MSFDSGYTSTVKKTKDYNMTFKLRKSPATYLVE